MANRPVSFRLYSSLTRVDDSVGQLLPALTPWSAFTCSAERGDPLRKIR